jgi:hypothetical protein
MCIHSILEIDAGRMNVCSSQSGRPISLTYTLVFVVVGPAYRRGWPQQRAFLLWGRGPG